MSDLKIENVEIIPVRIPLKKTGENGSWVNNTSGQCNCQDHRFRWTGGIGSVEPRVGYDEETPEEIAETVRNVLSPLIRDRNPFHIKQILGLMDNTIAKHHGSKGLVEMTLFDLSGKSLKIQVHQFF